MVEVAAALWGFFGSFAVEGLELYAALRYRGRWPWEQPDHPKPGEIAEAGAAGYFIAEVVRLVIGAGLAWAAAATGQIGGPLGALGVGVAAPTIIGQLAKAVPLAVGPAQVGNHPSHAVISVSPSKHEEHRLPAIDADGSPEAVE